MCIRDRYQRRVRGYFLPAMARSLVAVFRFSRCLRGTSLATRPAIQALSIARTICTSPDPAIAQAASSILDPGSDGFETIAQLPTIMENSRGAVEDPDHPNHKEVALSLQAFADNASALSLAALTEEEVVGWKVDQALYSFSVLHSASLRPTSSSLLGEVVNALIAQQRLDDAADMVPMLGGLGQTFADPENARAMVMLIMAVSEQSGFKPALELFESVPFGSEMANGEMATTCCNLLMASALDSGDKRGALRVLRSMESLSVPQDESTAQMLESMKTANDGEERGSHSEQQQPGAGGIWSSVFLMLGALLGSVGGLYAASESGMQMLKDKSRESGTSERETLAAEYSWTETEIQAQRSQLELARRRLTSLEAKLAEGQAQLGAINKAETQQGTILAEQAVSGPSGNAFSRLRRQLGKPTDRAQEKQQSQLLLAKALTESQVAQIGEAVESQRQELHQKEEDIAALTQELKQQHEAYQSAAGSASTVRGQQWVNSTLMSIGSSRIRYLEPGLSESIREMMSMVTPPSQEEPEPEPNVLEMEGPPQLPPALSALFETSPEREPDADKN
eukprot:TRINITY_DN28291_c0_g1_i2.p1 TRINITY_DN28291_c0_g1~~TRINITY_DN28291_c0_g1_i2.p1  ORF type:complete len:567 (-),score=191.11 TRINITY_DN28291_c0_g1_i2:318-2018(-)